MRNVFEVLRELLGLVKLVLEILKDLESRKRPCLSFQKIPEGIKRRFLQRFFNIEPQVGFFN